MFLESAFAPLLQSALHNLGCVPKTSAATSTTRTVQTLSSTSNTSFSNPNSDSFAPQAALTVHGSAFLPAQPTNGVTLQLENRVGLTSGPPAVSVISTEPPASSCNRRHPGASSRTGNQFAASKAISKPPNRNPPMLNDQYRKMRRRRTSPRFRILHNSSIRNRRIKDDLQNPLRT